MPSAGARRPPGANRTTTAAPVKGSGFSMPKLIVSTKGWRVTLYYQDDHVTLYHGDSLEILPTLDVQAGALLTDPPYFKVKNEDWDRQWAKPDEFLRWIGSFLDAAKPLLAPHASVWVFASPQLATDIEITVRDRFRVLNSIRWTKGGDTAHRRADFKTYRMFASPWEAIIFAEQYADEYGDASMALRKQVFSPVADYLKSEREAAGMSRKELAAHLAGYKNLESATANVSNWEQGKNAITEQDYLSARQALSAARSALTREYSALTREYYELREEFNNLRRPFSPPTRALANDIWDFAPVRPYPGKHPCEKPAPLLRHMIETSTRPGALILDPFAGSGSTLEVAAATGRHAIGIEKSEEYCEKIAHRLSTRTEQYALI